MICLEQRGVTMRFTGKIVLSIFAFISILFALGTYAVNAKVGNAQNTQATVQNVLSNEKASLVIGSALVDQLLKDMPQANKDKIKAPRSALDDAAAKVVRLSSVPISVQVGRAYDVFFNNQTAVIKMHDLIVAIAKALHAVDHNIKIDVKKSDTGNFTLKSDKSSNHVAMINSLNSIKRLINAWWIFLLMALRLFVGIAFLDKRKKVGAWRWPGFILFISGGLWLLAATLLPSLAGEGSMIISNNDAPLKGQDSLNAFGDTLGDALTTAAAGATLIGAVLIILSFFIKD